MSVSDEALFARFALAEEIGQAAGALALDYFRRRETLLIETKADAQDVVSIADRETERLIRGRIRAAFPEDGILGEEYGLEPGASGFDWIIDPIDGTAPFVNGLPLWCVSIGIGHGGAPVAGVIEAPCLNERFAAMRGRGARLNGASIRVQGADRLISNAMTGVGSNQYVAPEEVGRLMAEISGAGGKFFRSGSGALSLAWVAAGRLIGYYEPYMHAWDCWAGYALVTEAGGLVRPFPTHEGAMLRGAPVLAAAPSAFAELCAIGRI